MTFSGSEGTVYDATAVVFSVVNLTSSTDAMVTADQSPAGISPEPDRGGAALSFELNPEAAPCFYVDEHVGGASQVTRRDAAVRPDLPGGECGRS